MDQPTKDWIDTISKIIGLASFTVAAGMASWQVRKARIERAEQSRKDLEARRLNTKITQASFWLQLRRMFADHNDVHFNLRPDAAWSRNLPITELPKIESYMGLFEHCKLMLDDELIDLGTFKKIYAYRVRNIIRNPEIVFVKLMAHIDGWKDFVGLVIMLDLWSTLKESETKCLENPEHRQWRSTQSGLRWCAIMKEEFKIDVSLL